MKKTLVKAALLGAISGFLCIIAPNGSYNNTPVAIYQHPFNITVFYLIYFAVQFDHIYEHSMYNIRFKNIAAAKLYCLLQLIKTEFIYIIAYFICSCVLSYALFPENVELLFDPFRCILFLVTALSNLVILNIFFVNFNYLAKKNIVFSAEAGIILSGLALCFSAPLVVPYICIWYYGVYPKLTASPILSVFVYLIWAGAALLIGFIPQKDILRKE